MYSYRTGLGQVWVGSKLPPSPGTNIIWLKPSDDHRVLWEIRTYNIYKEEWEVLTSAALTAEGLLKLIYELEKRVDSLEELKVVLYDRVQSLTDDEKKTARENIGALGEEDLPEIVQEPGSDQKSVMSQDAVTKYTKTAVDNNLLAAKQYTDVIVRGHNTSTTAHIDIRELIDKCTTLPTYDPNTYKITFTTNDGATLEIDLPIEELGLSYNPETESIEFTNHAGEVESIPVSAFVKEYLGSIGDAIQITIDNNNVIHAVLLNNSINWDNLSKELQEKINNAISLEELEKHAVLYDKAQDLTTSEQNMALSNIGSGLFVLDIENGQATLTDAQEAALLSSKGVILRGTVNAGKEVLTKIYFSDYQGGDQVSFWAVRNNRYILQCIYTKSTKLFRFLTSASFIDPNAVSIKAQTLNATEQAQAWSNLGFDLVVLKFPEGATSVTLTDEEDAKLAAGAAVLVTVDGTNTSTGVYNADNHIFASYNFTMVPEPRYYSLWSNTSALRCSYKKASKTFVYNGSLQLNDTGALKTDRLTSLSGAQQSQAFKNLGWKVHVISESAIGSSDAVSDDEKAARLSATALLVKETGEMYIYGHNSTSTPSDRRFYRFRDTKTLALLNVVTTTGLITQPLFVNIYDENAVSFNINQSGVSDDRKNKALGNIGIDLVRLPYSLLNTTLSDEMMEVVDNARGIILVDTPSDYSNPSVFIKGNNVSGSCIFVAFVTGNTYSIFTLNKSTKLLSGISSGLTYGGSVRYAEEQSLTTAQQERALDNIGFPLVHLDFALIGTTLDDNIYNAVASAKGIILENVPDGNNAPSLYLVGNSDTVTTIFVSEFNARVWFVLTLSHTSKKLSLISTGYATDVVRYSEGQNLTNTQKDTVLSNIGLDFVHVDYSLLNTTLSDADFNRIWNAKGLIIVGNNEVAPVMLKGRSSLSQVPFYSIRNSSTLVYTVLLASTKKLHGLTSWSFNDGAVQYNVAQNLTDAKKQQARSNIDAVGSSGIKGVEIVYSTAPMQQDNILYIELEETTI